MKNSVLIMSCLSACILSLTGYGEDWKDPCILENEYLRIVVDRGRGATIRSLTDKRTGVEYAREFLSGKEKIGGIAEDRLAGETYGSEIVLLKYTGELSRKGDVQQVSLSCTPQIPKYRGWRFTKTFSLADQDAFVQVKWKIENIGKEKRTITPWVHNLVSKKFLNTVIAFPEGVRSVPPWDDYFRPAWRNWIGACSPDDFSTIWFCSDFSRTMRQYYCHWNGYHSVEWAYVPAILKPGESWESVYSASIGTPDGLPAAFCAEGALTMQLRQGELTASFCPARKFGDAAVMLELNGRQIGERQVNLKPGQNEKFSFGKVSGKGDAALVLPGKIRLVFHYDSEHGTDTGSTPLPFLGAPELPYKKIIPSAVPSISCGTVEGVGIYQVPFLRKIFEKDFPRETGKTLEDRVLRNSRFLRQIMLQNTSGKAVRLSISKEGRLPLSVRKVGFTETTEPSYLRDEFPIGRFPDPILPETPEIEIPAHSTVSLIAEAVIPEDAPVGKTQWLITLASKGKTVKIPLHCRVLKTALPQENTLWTSIGCWGLKEKLLREVQWTGTQKEFHRLCREMYYSHRLTPRENGMDWSLDDKQKKELLDLRDNRHAASLIVPNWILKNDSRLKKACTLLRETKMLDKAYVYCFDEVPSAKFPQVLDICRRIHAIEPELKILGTIYEKDVSPLYGEIGIWCRRIQDEPWRADRRRKGDMFMSSNLIGTDIEYKAEQVVLSLLALRVNHGKGFLFWNMIGGAGGDNPWKSIACSGGNGNAHLLYPHASGPIPTIRWKHLAYGIILYEQLSLLQKISPADYENCMSFAARVSTAEEVAVLENMILTAFEKVEKISPEINGKENKK